MPINKVAVIIPFYKEDLTEYEKISLLQCERTLSSYPVIAVKPQSLILPNLQEIITLTDTFIFDDDFFINIEGYNRLMLSPIFYEKFFSFEYILIYQHDAFVFKNQLKNWCNLRLDYIGAPWIRPIGYSDIFKAIKSHCQYYYHTQHNIFIDGIPSSKQFENKVGNGGFSLRRVKIFYDLTVYKAQMIDFYVKQTSIPSYNEDAFWSVEVNRKKKLLRIGTLEQGLKFAFELYPERAFILNKKQLPFGCHAWHRNLEYWRPIFADYGYNI